jgi:hypothetical protein
MPPESSLTAFALILALVGVASPLSSPARRTSAFRRARLDPIVTPALGFRPWRALA